jgi:hypothetical protein
MFDYPNNLINRTSSVPVSSDNRRHIIFMWCKLRRIKHVEEVRKNKPLPNVLTTNKQIQQKAEYFNDPIILSVEEQSYERTKFYI